MENLKSRNADFAHVDIMDNHFVPNLTWGLPVVEAVVRRNILPVDCHLMIEDPDRWAPGYAEAGAASVTFHAEAAKAPLRLANEIRKQGAKVGLGLRPDTDIHNYVDLLEAFDMILVMTVEPGFGGQPFLESQMPKSGVYEKRRSRDLDIAIKLMGSEPRNDHDCRRARALTCSWQVPLFSGQGRLPRGRRTAPHRCGTMHAH